MLRERQRQLPQQITSSSNSELSGRNQSLKNETGFVADMLTELSFLSIRQSAATIRDSRSNAHEPRGPMARSPQESHTSSAQINPYPKSPSGRCQPLFGPNRRAPRKKPQADRHSLSPKMGFSMTTDSRGHSITCTQSVGPIRASSLLPALISDPRPSRRFRSLTCSVYAFRLECTS